MPIIDFKEIPPGNSSDGEQDKFELFARDFLKEILNFTIVSSPNRGADGGKDILCEEIQKGILSQKKIKWLVSCKHTSHSGSSVKPEIEMNIIDRMTHHKADGFIGFYSTLPSSGLNNRLDSYKDSGKLIEVFDSERIEQMILENVNSKIFERYFPESYRKYSSGRRIRLTEEHESIYCKYCNKDLTEVRGENSLMVFAKDANEVIQEVYCVCKESCDDKLVEEMMLRGYKTDYEDLEDMIIPINYLIKYMANLNLLYDFKLKMSKEAFEEYKTILIRLAQLVFREPTQKEIVRMDNLNIMNSGIF